MLSTIILILIVLWFLGYAPISGISIPNFTIFTINNHSIGLWEILILAVIVWAIGILPAPLQTIAGVLLLLWIFSVLGVLAVAGLPNIIVLVIIIGLVLSLIF